MRSPTLLFIVCIVIAFQIYQSKSKCWDLIVSNSSLYFITVVSIKCWICQSKTDPKCGDPFSNRSLSYYNCDSDPKRPTDRTYYDVIFSLLIFTPIDFLSFTAKFANLTASMCRKIRQKVEGKWQVIRSCAYLGEPGMGTGNENNCEYTNSK